ncbi:MAG: hypothetical protein ACOCUM_00295 [Thiohalospira sp.]
MADAAIQKKSEFAGGGALVQLIGLLIFTASFAAFPVGPVLGFFVMLGFLVIGSRMSQKLVCGNCKNPVASKDVTKCPSCGADLEPPGIFG